MKLAVCVPYRNREEHLKTFVPYLTDYLTKAGIEHTIFICHQADDKPFNRGKLKNIAFMEAQKRGFDYFAFHDIDMLPEPQSCDYGYPEAFPVHLAVRKSDDGFLLPFDEYFGGCVLFTREQFQTVNGYSNEYWGWGFEDNDLFFRVQKKGLADIKLSAEPIKPGKSARFTGSDSCIAIKNGIGPLEQPEGFSVMILLQPEKEGKIGYMINDRFVYFETPLLSAGRKDLLVYNNYEEYSVRTMAGSNEQPYQAWPHQEWAMLFLTVDRKTRRISLCINGKEGNSWSKSRLVSELQNDEQAFSAKTLFFGNGPKSLFRKNIKPFHGKISRIQIWSGVLNEKSIAEQINHPDKNTAMERLIGSYDLSDSDGMTIKDGTGNNHGRIKGCVLETENSTVLKTGLEPHRRIGTYQCLPHPREGNTRQFLGHGSKLKRTEQASANKRRFESQVKTGLIDTDSEGLNTLEYKMIKSEKIYQDHFMIHVEC